MQRLSLQRFLGLLAAICLLANFSFAQEKQKAGSDEPSKDVIIIQKSDKDGKVKTKKIIRNGDELHEFQGEGEDGKVIIKEIGDGPDKEIKVIVNPEVGSMDLHQKVDVEIEEMDGEKHLKINVQPLDGEPKTFEWKGKGEIPEEVRKDLESEGIFLRELDGDLNSGEKGTFIFKKGVEGEDFQWTGMEEGGPFLGVVGAQGANVTVVIDENGERRTIESDDKPQNVDGVLINEVLEESAAAEAGLQKGDILKSIAGTPLKDFNDLVDFMDQAEVGQEVELTYERDGQLLQTEATLQERKGGMARNIVIDRIMEKEDDLSEDKDVFFFRSEDSDDIKIHNRHRIVVITRGDKQETTEDNSAADLPVEALPETKLERSLPLRDFVLFPNPSEGDLRLRFAAEAVPTVIRITDLNGKRVFRERLNRFDGNYDQNLDLSDLPAGLFLLSIEQADKVYTEQIVIK